MAVVNLNTEIREVMKPVVENVVTSVVLTLSPEEAAVVRFLAGNVRGHGTVRRAADSVWEALAESVDDMGIRRAATDALGRGRFSTNLDGVNFPTERLDTESTVV